MAYGVRKYTIFNRTYAKRGKPGAVKPISTKRIMVNGVQQKPGQRASKKSSQLKNVITKKTK